MKLHPNAQRVGCAFPTFAAKWSSMTSGLSITPAECLLHERVRRATELGTLYPEQRDAA
jgi:hypothetical protein